MTDKIINHDYLQSDGLQLVLQQLSESNEIDLVEQIYALSDRPEVLGLLIYKLMTERKKTNELMEGINKKYDALLEYLNETANTNTVKAPFNEVLEEEINIDNLFLTEQDKSILFEAKTNKWIDAKLIQDKLNYKGLNAASQRLNKLCKEGYLDKNRVGQSVVFVLNKKYI